MQSKLPTIGFIGNFVPKFSTENDRKWSFEQLGHTVIPFQENTTTFDMLMESLVKQEFDILFYSHTHGWEIPQLAEFFKECRGRRIPTVSVHLDRWAWLDRAKDIGTEATWFTEFLFMADFSPEAVELYKKHNLNAHYLSPGVLEKECVIAPPDPAMFPHEIIFVGSKGYHPEYPFRPALIDFLHETYGDRFGHYGNDGLGVVRGLELNSLYSTAKIVVGDSCFGGRPNYVSDRYYETRGRGGFLLHPHQEGIDRAGVGHYGGKSHDKENLEDLKKKIDYYLQNSYEREQMREIGFKWVREMENYTVRAQEMMRRIYAN